MEVVSLHVHPLKSGAPRPLDEVTVQPRGFVDDRSWMVVDTDGTLVSAREEPTLLAIGADTPVTQPGLASSLRLTRAGMPDLEVDLPAGAAVPVRLHRNLLHALPVGEAADTWLRSALGRNDVRLVWCDDPTRRQLNPAHSRPDDHTAFADGYPVTIATEASLAQLVQWIQDSGRDEGGDFAADQTTMRRFRPNVVVDGDVAFAEDDWREVTIGSVRFRVAKPVDRCVMTTIHPTTLAGGKEPIRSLARHRLSDERKTLFAVHLVPLGTGRVRVGDPVSAG